MITLLRRIRKSLIDAGPARTPTSPLGKYLLYAVGEAALVVLGILIALQVNNWNENRALRAKERRILLEIDRDLTRNIESLQEDIEFQKEMIENITYAIDHLESKKAFTTHLNKRLQSIKWIEEVTLSSSSFEFLKCYGMDLIRSDSLRSEIVQLFGFDYPQLVHFVNLIGTVQLQVLSIPALKKI